MAVFRNTQTFFLSFMLLAWSVSAQAQDVDQEKKILLKPGVYRLDSLFQLASQQTGVVFSYNAKKLNVKQHIKQKSGVTSLSKIFTLLKEEKGFSIKVMENYVVVTSPVPNKKTAIVREVDTTLPAEKRASMKKRSPQTILARAEKMDHKKDSVKRIPIAPEKQNTALKSDSTLTATDSVVTRNKQDESPVTSTLHQPSLFADSVKKILTTPAPLEKRDSIRIVKKSPLPVKKKTNKPSFFLKYGVSIDESAFTGIIAQAGFPLLFATLSANTNFKVSYARYGIGSSYKIGQNSQLQLNANFGNINRSGYFTDSVRNKFPIAVKSNLFRASISAEFSMGKKIKLQVGPVFNYLRTHYYINSVPSDLHLFKQDGDRIFYTLRPRYFIRNTFSPFTDSNIKTWIGLQVNVLFRLNY